MLLLRLVKRFDAIISTGAAPVHNMLQFVTHMARNMGLPLSASRARSRLQYAATTHHKCS